MRSWQAFTRGQRGLRRWLRGSASASDAHHRRTVLRLRLEDWSVWALEHKAGVKQLRLTAAAHLLHRELSRAWAQWAAEHLLGSALLLRSTQLILSLVTRYMVRV